MLLIEEPSRTRLIGILKKLIDGNVSREEVLSWQLGVVGAFGYEIGSASDVSLGPDDGYWYFHSLSNINALTGVPGGEESYFLRDQDLLEYLLDLEHVPARDGSGSLRRVRSHQLDHNALRWPLTTLYMPAGHLEAQGLIGVRGIFDPHQDPVEHCHVRMQDDLYLIVRQFDSMADKVMVLGSNRDPARLATFLRHLNLVA